MKTLFVCLANSKKYIERCIAGVVLTEKKEGGFRIERNGEAAKWVRPITNSETGAIPETLVRNLQLMDVCEIELIKEVPNSYQSENVWFDTKSLKKINKIIPTEEKLNRLVTKETILFGNTGKAVSTKKVHQVGNSLLLVKAKNPVVQATSYLNDVTEIESIKHRLQFQYMDVEYDFPITDVHFVNHFTGNPYQLKESKAIYVCVSLGMEHKGWHYKLAAGIISVP
ncbi:MAG: hypothetical protein HC892_12505 [Saprospiraceae bacterium]|nr:hypothetical protein [Saprospiraceae bacterium]